MSSDYNPLGTKQITSYHNELGLSLQKYSLLVVIDWIRWIYEPSCSVGFVFCFYLDWHCIGLCAVCYTNCVLICVSGIARVVLCFVFGFTPGIAMVLCWDLRMVLHWCCIRLCI